jgi:TusA-related sulfurtransferase
METLEMIEPCKTDFMCSNIEFENERVKIKGHCSELDVRDLEMPLPMITILDEMEELVEGQSLLVHHKKVPQYLLPELIERQFKIWITEIEEGYVKLLIHK